MCACVFGSPTLRATRVLSGSVWSKQTIQLRASDEAPSRTTSTSDSERSDAIGRTSETGVRSRDLSTASQKSRDSTTVWIWSSLSPTTLRSSATARNVRLLCSARGAGSLENCWKFVVSFPKEIAIRRKRFTYVSVSVIRECIKRSIMKHLYHA